VALGFSVFMEAEGKQNPKTGDTRAVVSGNRARIPHTRAIV